MNRKNLLIGIFISLAGSFAYAENACESTLNETFYQKSEVKASIEKSADGCVLTFEQMTAKEFSYEDLKELSEIPHDKREKSGVFWDDLGFNFFLSNQNWKEGMNEWDRPVDQESPIFKNLPEDIKADIEEGRYYMLHVKDLDILKDSAKVQYVFNNNNFGQITIAFSSIAEVYAIGAAENFWGDGYDIGTDALPFTDHNERTFQIPMFLSYTISLDVPLSGLIHTYGEAFSNLWESWQFEDDLGDKVISSVIGTYFRDFSVIEKYYSKILMPNTTGPDGLVTPTRIGHTFEKQNQAAIHSGLIKPNENSSEIKIQP